MNLVLGFVLLIACTFLGYFISQKYTQRKNFLNDFLCFNDKFKIELNFSNNSLKKIIDGANERDFYSLLKKSFFNKEVLIKESYLQSQDKELLTNYISEIGKSNLISQKELVDSTKIKLEELYKNACIDEKKYKSLYIKIGFLIGLIAFVVVL